MMKKLAEKIIVIVLLKLLFIFPVLAGSTSIEITANVVSVASLSIESDNSFFSVKNEITENEASLISSENIIDFGKVDYAGISRGSAMVDQISRLKNNLLVPENTSGHDAAVYIIGASESEYAVRIAADSVSDYTNARITIHKETSDQLELYYSYADENWKEDYALLGDTKHPSVSVQPSDINLHPETGFAELDFALKVPASIPAGLHQSIIVFTLVE